MIEFQGKFDSKSTTTLNNRVIKKMWWLFAVCSVFFVLLGILLAAFAEDTSDMVLGTLLIIFGLAFGPLVKLISHFMQKKLNNSMSILSPDTVQVFQFYPDKLVITQRKGDEYEATTTARYSYLYKVEETVSNYFLYISKVQTHVINKCDLVQGSLSELNGIFAANLGAKFKQV